MHLIEGTVHLHKLDTLEHVKTLVESKGHIAIDIFCSTEDDKFNLSVGFSRKILLLGIQSNGEIVNNVLLICIVQYDFLRK